MTDVFFSKGLDQFHCDVKSSATWEMSVNTSASTFGSRRVEEVVDILGRSALVMVLGKGESRRKSKSCMVNADSADVEVSMVW